MPHTITLNDDQVGDLLDAINDRIEHLESFIENGITPDDHDFRDTVRKQIERLREVEEQLSQTLWPQDVYGGGTP